MQNIEYWAAVQINACIIQKIHRWRPESQLLWLACEHGACAWVTAHTKEWHEFGSCIISVSPIINYFQREPETSIKYSKLKLIGICKQYSLHAHKFNWIYPIQEIMLFLETIICQIKILCWVWDTFTQLLTKGVLETGKTIKAIGICCGLNKKLLA